MRSCGSTWRSTPAALGSRSRLQGGYSNRRGIRLRVLGPVAGGGPARNSTRRGSGGTGTGEAIFLRHQRAGLPLRQPRPREEDQSPASLRGGVGERPCRPEYAGPARALLGRDPQAGLPTTRGGGGGEGT